MNEDIRLSMDQPPLDVRVAKPVGHWWCSSCKIMGTSLLRPKCAHAVEEFEPLKKTV